MAVCDCVYLELRVIGVKQAAVFFHKSCRLVEKKPDDKTVNLETICEKRKWRGVLLWQILPLAEQWWIHTIAAAGCRGVSLALLTVTVCIMTVVRTLFIKLSARLWQRALLMSLSTFLKGPFAISVGCCWIFKAAASNLIFQNGSEKTSLGIWIGLRGVQKWLLV